MNDKLKNSGESYTESPEDTLEMALDKARENFQYSPEILNHLEETLEQLNNTMTGVKLPRELLLRELQVSNKVFDLMGSESAIKSMNGFAANDSSYKLAA